MKRLMAVLIALTLLAGVSVPAAAAGRARSRAAHARTAHARTNNAGVAAETRKDGRSFWQKHRDKLTVAGGAVGGAIIGGLIGGKRGAGVGILAGGAGAAVYTYKIRKKERNY